MNPKHLDENYWSYYLNLESDFITTQRYVTIDQDNFSSFSLEYVKQYQAICSEIDVVCERYCLHLNAQRETSNIKDNANLILPKKPNIIDYANIILHDKPNIILQGVSVKNQSNIQLNPWKDWSITPKHISPVWWSDYNKVKHSRTSLDAITGKENYKKANLVNTINALAGLLILEMYFYKDLVVAKGLNDTTIPSRASNLFIMDDWEKHSTFDDLFEDVVGI